MSDDRWVVLGLAHARAGWFRDLARWSTAAAVPVDFVKCVSAHEVRARLHSGRTFSTLLVGGDMPGLDLDLVETVRAANASVIVVDPVAERDWSGAGVAAVLQSPFDRSELMGVLVEHASPITAVAIRPVRDAVGADAERGRLVAVTGPGGTGASVVAMALAQMLAADPDEGGRVLLADLARHADQGMLHDAREVMPCVQELVEAHRSGPMPPDQTRALAFEVADRGYQLLLGLRRHRDWTAVRPRAFRASLEGLLCAYRLVVADVDDDIEGEQLTGSIDVEDRNVMARTTIERADLVVVVGAPTAKGLHAMARTVRNLAQSGVGSDRLLPLLNRAPRGPRRRAEAVAALAALLDGATDDPVTNPVFAPDRPETERAIRDGARLPSQVGRTLHREVVRRLDESPGRRSMSPAEVTPQPVEPGSLGVWTEEAG